MAKEWAKDFYNSKAWQNCRSYYISKVHGLCEECLKENRVTIGLILHHKILLTLKNINDFSISLNEDNLQLLCQECHNKVHHSSSEVIRKGARFDSEGQIVKDDF